MNLHGKNVLLVGASGGIGQAIAGHLSEAGASLVLVGRNEDKLKSLGQSLSGPYRIVMADINTSEGRESVLEACRQSDTQPGIDVFVNAAGVMDFVLFEQQDVEGIEKVITTNLLSPMLLCRGLLPLLLARPEAVLVNIGSIFGSIGHPGFASYCTSKFGLRGFTEALQRELATSPVRVIYLAPRATQTDLNDGAVSALNEALGNTSDAPEKVAAALMKALSSSRLQSYMGWPEKIFVRLNSLFPGVVHKALVKKLPLIRHHAKT